VNKHSKLAVVLRKNYRETKNLLGIKSSFDRTYRVSLVFANIKIRWKSGDGLGRFGGGWNWAVGFETNKKLNCWIINLLFFYVRIDFKRLNILEGEE